MRFIIYGAGAVGGTIGALLHRSGAEVVLIARGAHLEAIRSHGLTLAQPDGEQLLQIPAVGSPKELELGPRDVVVLAMKGQHTHAALEELETHADPDVAIMCAQNGVENERLALRRFAEVYGVLVQVAARHLQAGRVEAFSQPVVGALDIGPGPRAPTIAESLRHAGFSSYVRSNVMRWKYAKLLANLGTTIQALFGPEAYGWELNDRARAEALACYKAAGIEFASAEEAAARYSELSPWRDVAGSPYAGGSSWQSIARGQGNIEVDSLNGEIVLLGRLHGVATPVNEGLQRMALALAASHAPPASADPQELEALIAWLSRQRHAMGCRTT